MWDQWMAGARGMNFILVAESRHVFEADVLRHRRMIGMMTI
jgi:hypothetical protein